MLSSGVTDKVIRQSYCALDDVSIIVHFREIDSAGWTCLFYLLKRSFHFGFFAATKNVAGGNVLLSIIIRRVVVFGSVIIVGRVVIVGRIVIFGWGVNIVLGRVIVGRDVDSNSILGSIVCGSGGISLLILLRIGVPGDL